MARLSTLRRFVARLTPWRRRNVAYLEAQGRRVRTATVDVLELEAYDLDSDADEVHYLRLALPEWDIRLSDERTIRCVPPPDVQEPSRGW